MRARMAMPLLITTLLVAPTACKKQIDPAPFITALDKSYAGQHVCLWAEPVKLPAEFDPSKDARVRDFDALTDAGLLVRENVVTPKPHLPPVKTNKYTLSDKAHSAWISDPDHPDSGNICFGHFNVTNVDKATPNDPANPTQYTVAYRYEVEGIPGWARTPESMRAFPKIADDTTLQSATATLVKAPDGSWTVTTSAAPPAR